MPGKVKTVVIILLFVCLILTTPGLAGNLSQQVSCPVCKIDYSAIIISNQIEKLCIDGRPLSGKILPPAECPLCHGVYGNAKFTASEIADLKSFIWSAEFQKLKNSSPLIRHAALLELLERSSYEIAQAWLNAAWANENNPALHKSALKRSLKYFKDYLNLEKPPEECLFDVSLKIADLLRQLEQFSEARQWLKQMLTYREFQKSWLPMTIRHSLSLVDAKNSKPAALPQENYLHTAIAAGNIDMVEKLLSDKKLTGEVNTDGVSPLMLAIKTGNEPITSLLLKNGADPEQTDLSGQTPLHLAITENKFLLLRPLLQAGADIQRKDGKGNTILHLLCTKTDTSREKLLAEIISQFPDVNQRNFNDLTAFHVAAEFGSKEMLRILVNAGANVDARLPDGNSALFFCKPAFINTLIKLGANPELKNNAGQTAFLHARINGISDRIMQFKKISNHGIKASIQDLDESPLHKAVLKGNADEVNQLLANGADANATSDFLRTPLHYAATRGDLDIVRILCLAKANIHALDARGSTPMHDAAAARHRKVYNFLREQGGSDTTKDNSGNTPADLLGD